MVMARKEEDRRRELHKISLMKVGTPNRLA